MKYKVRYHLGKGLNFMQWQITCSDKSVIYVDPKEHEILLKGCRLINRQATARKIFEGENKRVCAWIECNEYVILGVNDIPTKGRLFFNPRKCVHWHDQHGENRDHAIYDLILCKPSGIFHL